MQKTNMKLEQGFLETEHQLGKVEQYLCKCGQVTRSSWVFATATFLPSNSPELSFSLLTIGPTSSLFIRFKCRRNNTCQRAPMSLGRTNSIFLFNFLTKKSRFYFDFLRSPGTRTGQMENKIQVFNHFVQ